MFIIIFLSGCKLNSSYENANLFLQLCWLNILTKRERFVVSMGTYFWQLGSRLTQLANAIVDTHDATRQLQQCPR